MNEITEKLGSLSIKREEVSPVLDFNKIAGITSSTAQQLSFLNSFFGAKTIADFKCKIYGGNYSEKNEAWNKVARIGMDMLNKPEEVLQFYAQNPEAFDDEAYDYICEKVESGAINLESKDHFNRSFAHIAALNGNTSFLKLLKQFNQDLDVCEEYVDLYPIDLAAKKLHLSTLEFLLENILDEDFRGRALSPFASVFSSPDSKENSYDLNNYLEPVKQEELLKVLITGFANKTKLSENRIEELFNNSLKLFSQNCPYMKREICLSSWTCYLAALGSVEDVKLELLRQSDTSSLTDDLINEMIDSAALAGNVEVIAYLQKEYKENKPLLFGLENSLFSGVVVSALARHDRGMMAFLKSEKSDQEIFKSFREDCRNNSRYFVNFGFVPEGYCRTDFIQTGCEVEKIDLDDQESYLSFFNRSKKQQSYFERQLSLMTEKHLKQAINKKKLDESSNDS